MSVKNTKIKTKVIQLKAAEQHLCTGHIFLHYEHSHSLFGVDVLCYLGQPLKQTQPTVKDGERVAGWLLT